MQYKEGSNSWLRKLFLRDPPKSDPVRPHTLRIDKKLGHFNATGFHPTVEAPTPSENAGTEQE